MNKKILLTSLMSVAMLASIATGATYALFTAEDTANITIQSGKVNVKANVSSITHYTNGVAQADSWVNGGKVTYSDGNISIDRITPGDSVEIVIDVENLSNVAASYRTLVDVIADNGLAEGLDITIDSSNGTSTVFHGFAYHDWASLDSNGVVESIKVCIGLPLEAGNEYQDKNTTIKFSVEAVQGNASMVNTVDGLTLNENGEYLVTSATDLKILGANVNNNTTLRGYYGKTIKLANNIDLSNDFFTPIGNSKSGFCGTFDGGDFTISNFVVQSSINAGLFGYALNGGNVKNLKVENAVINANDYAGAIMGRGYTDIDNCHVKNVTVTTTPYLNEDGDYDGGAKAGGVIGQLLEGSGNTVTNCSATDVKVYAFRDLGGVVGMVHSNNTATNNTATNITLGYILYDKITEDENENAGAIYGRVSSSATVSPAKDSVENTTYTLVYAVVDENSLRTVANNVSAGNNYSKKTVVLLNDIDLENRQWTSIGVNRSKPFSGTFDGGEHTISNLYIDSVEESYLGLFGYTLNANVKNINVHNVNIHGYSQLGTIAGNAYTSTISNAHVSGSIKIVADYAYAAGIASSGYVKISDCSVIADNRGEITVHESSMAGGISGWLGEGSSSLTNCHVKNLDITSWASVGALTGLVHYNNTIDGCSAENVNLTKTRELGWASIGLASGNWVNKSGGADYTITITNNSFKNISITGTAITELNRLYGSNYNGNTVQIKLVESSNTYENITVNFAVVSA